jgi:16S rRNA (adenine1518-N6/adenine1519-N6)-dimethyltransferase
MDDGLPPLGQTLRRLAIVPRKGLGQNFLLDLNLTSRIAGAAGPLDGVEVLEIGPGPGGLTRALLAGGAARVVVIEQDRRCLPALAEIAARYPGRLEVHPGDALAIDHAALVRAGARVVANLPYNIATPLLIGWLRAEPWPPWFDRLVLMFQKEVAARIVAAPGGKAYGRLSVIAQTRARARILFEVGPKAFTPPPKVTSAVVELVPLAPGPDAVPLAALERVTQAAFGQRRKMLRASLRPLAPDAQALCAQAGIDPTWRAEQVDIAGFARLARVLADG